MEKHITNTTFSQYDLNRGKRLDNKYSNPPRVEYLKLKDSYSSILSQIVDGFQVQIPHMSGNGDLRRSTRKGEEETPNTRNKGKKKRIWQGEQHTYPPSIWKKSAKSSLMTKIREATDLMHETRRSNNPSCTRCAGERSEQQTLLRASEQAKLRPRCWRTEKLKWNWTRGRPVQTVRHKIPGG